MVVNAALSRRLALLFLLVVLGLLRAEQGVAELQGRAGEPSRMFRLLPEGDGYWSYALLGLEGRVMAELPLIETGGPLLSSDDLPRVSDLLAEVGAQIDRLRQPHR